MRVTSIRPSSLTIMWRARSSASVCPGTKIHVPTTAEHTWGQRPAVQARIAATISSDASSWM